MSLIHMIRRISPSNVVPLAVRLASASQRHYHHCSTIISAANRRSNVCENLFRRSMPSTLHRYFCNLPEEENALVQVIEEQIADAKDVEVIDEDMVPIPVGELPFEIEDYATQNHIKLTRNYRDERIEVTVDTPILIVPEDDASAEDNRCDSQLPLIVRIFKKERCLEFVCSAYSDYISIESVTFKNPDNLDDELCYDVSPMWSLDERMEHALLKYLEIRGIKLSTTDFLNDYMVKKDGIEFVSWLHTFKDFVKS